MILPAVTEAQPLEDPDRVDERRARVGLGPLAEYRERIRRHDGGG